MHHYELFWRACNTPFSKIRTPIEPNEGQVVCPRCGSEEAEQRWFYLAAAKEST
jgi:RNA polymerase subunit RPABC4/transcription elongation factor Spt4